MEITGAHCAREHQPLAFDVPQPIYRTYAAESSKIARKTDNRQAKVPTG